ncbi:MAG: DUF1761 domain-containing protein [Bradyrhizobiaceae bacterium]|nr:DUF1761 domain-containing protein [Bradyrhizobiaceae bacterium]
MSFAGINYLAVVIAALAGFGFGAVYYMALATPWMNAVGWSPEQQAAHLKGQLNPSKLPFLITIVANLVMAWLLAGVIGHLGPGQVTIRNGIVSAAFLWLGFVATTLSVNYAFGMRKPMLALIDGGHWLGVLLIMGAVIGAFGI